MKRVLVVLDGSALAEEAIPQALVHARAAAAELCLLHVIATVLPLGHTSSRRERERLAWLYLGTVAESLRDQGLKVTCRVQRGLPLSVVVQEATRCDLLILATRAAALLERVLRRTLVLENRLILIRPGPRTATPDGKVRSFDADARGHEPLAPHTLGLRTVALDRIVGSVDRASELRTNFLPYFAREGDSRYLQIREAMEGGESLPAIELYKLGREYYVLDGHHRVAAALSLGQAEIDASVTEYVPMQDSAACRVFGERRVFERATGLTRIGASRPGHYPRLQALIVAYAEAAGIADPQRAAARWHVDVFQPLAARLRSAQLGGIFPGERTADLLVHLAEFRATEEEFLGRSIPWDYALDMWLKRLRGGQRRLGARLPHLRRTDATEG